jgi:hypothetical protein
MFGVEVAVGFFQELAPKRNVMVRSRIRLVLMYKWLNSFGGASKKITATFSNGCHRYRL